MGTDAPHRKIVEAFDVDSMESTATAFGLLHGAVLDLRRGWDLGDPVQVRRLWALLESSRPLLVIGSPMSTRSEKHYEEHLKTCMAVYRWQHENGGLFLHEHKEGALSLSKSYVKAICGMEGVMSVRGDQCAYGRCGRDAMGAGRVQAPTQWLTNDYHLSAAVSRRCNTKHRHAMLKRTSHGERWPMATSTCEGGVGGFVHIPGGERRAFTSWS